MSAPFPLKPWWRSVGFWLGAVVAVFLAWVMVDAIHRQRQLYYVTTFGAYGLTTEDANLQVMGVEMPSGHPMKHGWHHDTGPAAVGPGLEPKTVSIGGSWNFLETEQIVGREFRTFVSIPLWFVLFLWCAAWLGMWFGCRRRIRRRIAEAG